MLHFPKLHSQYIHSSDRSQWTVDGAGQSGDYCFGMLDLTDCTQWEVVTGSNWTQKVTDHLTPVEFAHSFVLVYCP